uniref:Uncharacterized protein n=1 Tax=Arundo donax TaxID=35708 RepID=A0A0A8ZEP4_ARUDO
MVLSNLQHCGVRIPESPPPSRFRAPRSQNCKRKYSDQAQLQLFDCNVCSYLLLTRCLLVLVFKWFV